MAEEDAFLVDDVEGGLCVDYTDAKIVRRCYCGSFKYKGKWENDDYICKGHKLNGMSDSLFDVYRNVESTKKLWDSFKSKYMENDASSKKFLDFKHTLKHGKDDLSLVQLGSHLRIEESLRAQESDKGNGKEVGGPSVNMIKEGAPYTTQQNGVAKRKNKALKEMVNSMLSYLGLSEGFWGEAMAVVMFSNPKRKTLVEKGIDCIFVGYAEHSKAYRILDPMMKLCNLMMLLSGKKQIDDEIGSIMENNTWVLSDLPPGCKPLGYKWMFKRKMKVDGTIDKFKARLVTHGYRQKKGIDYFNTTFFNGDLDEEVYMKQPEGFVMPGDEHTGCKLVKSFKFDSFGKGVIICLYLDDMLIFGTDQNQVDKTKKFLSSKFSMKYMGEADVILAFAASGNEAEWLRNLIHEIPIWLKIIAPISFHWDSAATFSKSYSQMYNGKSRHLDTMEKLLYEASHEGNIIVLLELLQDDQLILDRVTLNRYGDMPLHIASLLGHVDFVNEILTRKPYLAMEFDLLKHLHLHIASDQGHVEIVKSLALANPETCLVRDRDGRTPLHLVAIKGRSDVVKELMQAQPLAFVHLEKISTTAARLSHPQTNYFLLHMCM
nr:ankyrin repeat-containing domain, PGG domain protein [Tanacetum cinerariifolium]